jgi:hypothetical protein
VNSIARCAAPDNHQGDVFKGGLNESVAQPREIFRTAILQAAFALVVVHNLCGATHKLCYVQPGAMCSVRSNYRHVKRFIKLV